MRRWQDRGEVLDSDDEEEESQGQERIAREAVVAKQSTSLAVDEDTAKSEDVFRQDVYQARDEEQGTDDLAVSGLSEQVERSLRNQQVTRWKDARGALNYGHYNDRDHTGSQSHEGALFQSSPSAQSETLPDLRDLFGDAQTRAQQHQTNDASMTSSPLTEREVSPPSGGGATFRFPRFGGVPTAATVSDHSEDDDPAPPQPDDIFNEVLIAAQGRRNLRARKEKQLHPYLFDKAQHQKQFKERGMRPIRYEPERKEAETQEASLSDDQKSTQSFGGDDGLRNQPSFELGMETFSYKTAVDKRAGSRSQYSSSDDEEQPEPPLYSRTPLGIATYSNKRRKLFHPLRLTQSASAHQLIQGSVNIEPADSVPPSPPPTSSGSASRGPLKSATDHFRMPRGLTPEALPTPQISSEIREAKQGRGSDESEAESLAPRSRPSTITRRQVREITVSSPSEASEAEPDAEMVDRRLHRERKRIKGVLPASWLKIDFRAQQRQLSQSPRKVRRDSSPSPVRTLPQKGVAQRVLSRATLSPRQQNVVTIPDDESDGSGSPSPPLLPTMRQSRLEFDRDSSTVVQPSVLDDEDMEADWVDPMLAGSSRPRYERKKRGKRQPRITESFANRHTQRLDLSEELKSARRADGVTFYSKESGTRAPKQRRRRTHAPPRLSVIDAPAQFASTVPHKPQFLRIAIRRARTHANHARHSPTHKHIRLATRDETEDACSVLRSWREGAILPRNTSGQRCSQKLAGNALIEDDSDDILEEHLHLKRTPLAELHHNRQRQLPQPLRRQLNGQLKSSSTLRGARDSKMRQTQLRPIVMPGDDDSEEQDTSEADPHTPAQESARQPHRHARVHIQPVRYRAAQLESVERYVPTEHRAVAFQHRMNLLAEHVVRSHRESGRAVQLDRFLHDDDLRDVWVEGGQKERSSDEPNVQEADTGPPSTRLSLPQRPRKRQANHVDADSREYRQPSEPLPVSTDPEIPQDKLPLGTPLTLNGLGPFGTRYATNFDILPLPLQTHFHTSSFIGSGDFAASLNFANRDLDVPSGHIRVHINDEVLEWGAWTEDVAVGLSRIPKALSEVLQNLDMPDPEQSEDETLTLVMANADYLLRSTVRYFMWCLYFFDPVDRLQCISSLSRLIDDLIETVAGARSKDCRRDNVFSRCLQYVVILARQQLGLCDHSLVSGKTKFQSGDDLLRVAKCLVNHSFPKAFEELRAFYEDIRSRNKRELGIRDDDTAVCSVIVLYHATQNARTMTADDLFWTAINHRLPVDFLSIPTVRSLDQIWYDLFTVLPILEIDSQGFSQAGGRFGGLRQNWTIPRNLVKRLFALYPATSLEYGSTVNEYVRAMLTRCSYLISRWGWWKCEFFLGSVFDFFSKRGLKQLHNEEVRGSPRFLDELQQQPSLEVQPEDRAFHILLKMLASALQGMRKYEIYPDKRIGSIAWRFIPNHGRTYRKDAELLQEDLDALRNHHDLLCVSYCFAPPSCRIRVNIVQNLVDHSVSHREACRLNVRAWQRLTSFEASTNEEEQRLDDLCGWFRDMMTITMNQYQLARSEIELEIAAARTDGTLGLPSSAVEDIIARNQRQIAATLIDLLAALKCALQASRSAAIAKHLLDGSCFWQFFSIFEPSERRLYGVLFEALSIVRISLDTQAKFRTYLETPHDSEDSQEYGDSSALQQLVSSGSEDQEIANGLHAPLATLLSNIFGADATTDDGLLTEVVDIWVLLAQTNVRHGNRTWSSYISGYDSDAWGQLRDTEQKRKYTPYFLSRVVEKGDVDLAESNILTSWFQSLVEREAKLRFQHALTTALLIRHAHEPLLSNFPFSRQGRAGYAISLSELRQRRLAVISSVLSNMRESFNETLIFQPSAVRQLRQTYAAMLKQLMQSMKSNYQELQAPHGKELADAHAEGAYVAFVQQVVAFLQEYTTDICTVDRFFTDSPAFPLPANDPTYVVGRLRSYVPKLSESGRRKELANFVHNVCERAITDRKQAYLVDQLFLAMDGTIDQVNASAPGLRQVLCSAIFAAYLENALSSECSWIIAEPIFQTCERIAGRLLYLTRTDDNECLGSTAETVAIFLQSASRPLRSALAEPARIGLLHVQRVLRLVFTLARSCLTCAQYFQSIRPSVNISSGTLASYFGYAAHIEAALNGSERVEGISEAPMENEVTSRWPDTIEAARKQVQDSLSKNWHFTDGRYYLKRGENSVEILVDLGSEERTRLIDAVVAFQMSYRAIFEGKRNTYHRRADDCNVGAVIV